MPESFQSSNPPGFNQLEIPIFQKTYDFYKDFHESFKHFPRTDKYTIGQRILNLSLETLELILLAGYKPKNEKLLYLDKASAKLDVLKVLLRLSFETKAIKQQKYIFLTNILVETGKMLGGWIKQTKTT